jgi:hypothetical protein
MSKRPGLATLSALAIMAGSPAPLGADDMPDPAAVAAAMRKANDFFVSKLASRGGYASSWSLDLTEAKVEARASRTVISIQPPGTTTVGLAMLRAWQATGDEAFLAGARGAAKALLDCQLESGGWPADFDFGADDEQRWHLRRDVLAGDAETGKRRNLTTLDDNKTQSAMLFLLELAHDPAGKDDEDLRAGLAYAFDKLLAAQHPIGSWPQQFSEAAPVDGIVKKARIPAEWPRVWPAEKYHHFHTLNDNNLQRLVELMLRAHELTGDARFLASAKRVGEFLLLAQYEGDQPAWSQQYNLEMVPVWARKFEPPALSSSESLGACQTLFEVWLATGEERYREAIERALGWLERCRLPDGRMARFYEFGTNRPLYCVAETYELTYDDSNLPTHYGFKPDFPRDKIDRLRADLAKPREELLASRREPDSPEAWTKLARGQRSKVATALSAQEAEGYWRKGDRIDAEAFAKSVLPMAAYLKALGKAGKGG